MRSMKDLIRDALDMVEAEETLGDATGGMIELDPDAEPYEVDQGEDDELPEQIGVTYFIVYNPDDGELDFVNLDPESGEPSQDEATNAAWSSMESVLSAASDFDPEDWLGDPELGPWLGEPQEDEDGGLWFGPFSSKDLMQAVAMSGRYITPSDEGEIVGDEPDEYAESASSAKEKALALIPKIKDIVSAFKIGEKLQKLGVMDDPEVEELFNKQFHKAVPKEVIDHWNELFNE